MDVDYHKKAFFADFLEESNTCDFAGGMQNSIGNLYDFEMAQKIWNENPDDFLNEYKNTVAFF